MTTTPTPPSTGAFDFDAAVRAFLELDDPTGALAVLDQLGFTTDGTTPGSTTDAATLARILSATAVQNLYFREDMSETAHAVIERTVVNVPADVIAAAMLKIGAMKYREDWLEGDALEEVEADIAQDGEQTACNNLIAKADDLAELICSYVARCNYYGALFKALADALKSQASGEG